MCLTMKKYYVVLIIILCSVPIIEAKKGVGIVWVTEKENAHEEEKHCIDYGLYNPWDEPIKVTLQIHGELASIISHINTQPQTIHPFTSSKDPLVSRICFTVPEIYKKNCVLGSLLCEKQCTEPTKQYDGYVSAQEETDHSLQKSGSTFIVDVAAPLQLKVDCIPYERSYGPIIILFLFLFFFIFLIKKVKRSMGKQKRRKL